MVNTNETSQKSDVQKTLRAIDAAVKALIIAKSRLVPCLHKTKKRQNGTVRVTRRKKVIPSQKKGYKKMFMKNAEKLGINFNDYEQRYL